ncbi:MAG: sialic acid synthase, partial [Proteobacteria bacterium]|nr:sialic acid synthase [Pseudomonadota bacterium]
METDKYKLNAYSSRSDQIAKWIKSHQNAVKICGGEHKPPASPEERNSLDSLKRGVYAKTNIKKGGSINREDVFFAMPLQKDQLNSGEWWNGITADQDYPANAPVSNDLANLDVSKEELGYRIMLQVKGMFNNARIFIGSDSSIEISSHYGLERFREFGAVIITCINREYCKKLVIQL